MTIIHEIGHALGLSHPYEDPANGNWNTDDTIMSYNSSPDGWGVWFSDLDIAALIKMWGSKTIMEGDLMAQIQVITSGGPTVMTLLLATQAVIN